MSGDWLKFEVATPDKPEVWQIANDLDLDPDAVIGKLLRVWCWFDQQTEIGNAPIVTKKLLDRLVCVNGFCDAVIKCGWMIQDDQSINLPNFGRHNGKTAKNRALTAKRVAAHKDKTNAKGNDDSVSVALPREEKRREDIYNNDQDQIKIQYEKIKDAYNETIGQQIGKIKAITPSRKTGIKARIGEDPEKRINPDWWQKYFDYASSCPLLIGMTPPKEPGGKPWKADFDWLINANNLVKVIEGKYDAR